MRALCEKGNSMTPPDIAVVYNEQFSNSLFEKFKDGISNEKLSLVIESREDDGPYMCSEWFILTGIAVFIGKSYFDGFLKEAGKDHYQALKTHLSELTNDVMTTPRIEPVILGTEGKISSKNPYSLAFSIYAEAGDGNRFKLLLPKPNDASNYTEIIHMFLEFLNDYHSGVKVLDSIGYKIERRPSAGMIFVHMDPASEKIEWLDEREFR
jgi:hypothetical protein